MTGFKSLLDDFRIKDDPIVTYGDNGKGVQWDMDPSSATPLFSRMSLM